MAENHPKQTGNSTEEKAQMRAGSAYGLAGTAEFFRMAHCGVQTEGVMKKCRQLILAFLCGILLAACSPASTDSITTVTVMQSRTPMPYTKTLPPTGTNSPTVMATPSLTASQSATMSPTAPFPSSTFTSSPDWEKTYPPDTKTFTPTSTVALTPTLIATANRRQVLTPTPGPAAICPDPFPGGLPRGMTFSPLYSEATVLKILNLYGPQPVFEAFDWVASKRLYWEWNWDGFNSFDLTHDTVPEMIVASRCTLDILGCVEGKYQNIFSVFGCGGWLMFPEYEILGDGNRNGTPELLILTGIPTQGGSDYEILEWNGETFFDLCISDSSNLKVAELFTEPGGSIYYRDMDGDSIDELIVESGIPVWSIYSGGLPWRNETQIFKWDGVHYVLYRVEYDPPTYRFQAVQDADRFSFYGEYDRALEMYQQVIDNEDLEWWSVERREQLQQEWSNNIAGVEETLVPLEPDLEEYAYLSAYAHYRIMLVHVLQGQAGQALKAYQTLQQKYPDGNPGHEYAEMAAAFWNNYKETHRMLDACSQAISYAEQNPITFYYLGRSIDHGDQSIIYKREEVCPFR